MELITINNYIDLHMHTNFSDGTFSPKALVKLCKEKNIHTFSITDHDTISGLEEGSVTAEKLNIKFISGIEMSALYDGVEIHLLCYGFDYKNPLLDEFLMEKVINARHKRNLAIIQKLNSLNIPIKLSDLNANNSEAIITRAHFSAYLIQNNIVKDRYEAFEKYLSEDGLAYVPKILPSAQEVISFSKKINGFMSLAHPNLYNYNNSNILSKIETLKNYGLDGIECYHSSYKKNFSHILINICGELDLIPTGGSDFHGSNKKDVALGQFVQDDFLNEEKLSKFINQINILNN